MYHISKKNAEKSATGLKTKSINIIKQEIREFEFIEKSTGAIGCELGGTECNAMLHHVAHIRTFHISSACSHERVTIDLQVGRVSPR